MIKDSYIVVRRNDKEFWFPLDSPFNSDSYCEATGAPLEVLLEAQRVQNKAREMIRRNKYRFIKM